jgi:putative transcriptional regulator
MRGKFPQLRSIGIAVCTSLILGGHLPAQEYFAEPELTAGSVLVANAKLADPNFSQTVILIVQYDEERGAEGLILNRQSELSIAGVFPHAKHATKDPVYLGGPVEIRTAQALFRLPDKTEHAIQVLGDVYVSGAKELIDKSIDSHIDPSKFRLYLGYAGWADGQLAAELRLGAWSRVNGSSKLVFDPHPETLWARLTHSGQTRLAAAPRTAPAWFVSLPHS